MYNTLVLPDGLFTLHANWCQNIPNNGSNILLRNVHTAPRQGKKPGSIVSHCAGPVPVPVPVQVVPDKFLKIVLITLRTVRGHDPVL